MILEDATFDAYGYYPSDLSHGSGKRILATCDECGKIRAIRKRDYRALCMSCSRKGGTGEEASNWKGGEVKRICKVCGNIFYVPQCIVKNGEGNYCSKSCSVKSNTGEKSSNWKGGKVERICKLCGKTFFVRRDEVKKGHGNYCSRSCSTKSKTGEESSNWKGGEVKRICKVCGKTFYAPQADVKRGRGIYCSNSCATKARRHNARPEKTAPERIFEAICIKNDLPFKFVGDGALWLGNANPDFVHNTKKIVVEVFGYYWHGPLVNRNVRYTGTVEGRTKQLAAEGYKTIILWELDLMREDAEKFILHEMHNRGIIK